VRAPGRYAFIFDMDGTLVDNMRFHAQAWAELFASLGVAISSGELRARTSGKTSTEILRGILGPHLSEGEVAEYIERKEELYRAAYLPHMKPIAGLDHFLSEAHRLNIPMAVATSAGERNIHFVLGGLGLEPYFQLIVGAEDVRWGKPNPAMLLTAAHRLKVAPEGCLVFEDSLAGLEAVRRAGMRAIAITTTHAAHELQGLPAVIQVIADYCGLNPASLLEMLSGSGSTLNQPT